MNSAEMLKRLLEVTEENNRILKDLQENGLAIRLPSFDRNDSLPEPEAPQIREELKPKISKTKNEVLDLHAGFTAWIDEATGLMWEVKNHKTKDLVMSQKESNGYVDNLNILEYSGFNDWRLPTLKEMKTLLTSERQWFFFTNKPLSKNTNYGYWTATKYDENFYMTINFRSGKDIKSEKNNVDYVRCVRGTLK
jgi:hypothetical protein